MVERYTRRPQKPLSERACGFESRSRHFLRHVVPDDRALSVVGETIDHAAAYPPGPAPRTMTCAFVASIERVMGCWNYGVSGPPPSQLHVCFAEALERIHQIHGEPRGCSAVDHTVIPDRIEAGTFAIAGSQPGSEIILENVIAEHLLAGLDALPSVSAK